ADADGFGLAVADDVDSADAARAVATGKPEIGNLDAALRAVYLQHIVEVDHDGAGNLGDDAVLEGEDRSGPVVGAFGIEGGGATDHDRIGKGLADDLAGNVADHGDRIAADIHDAATGQIGGKEAVLGLELAHGEAKARLDHAHLAN